MKQGGLVARCVARLRAALRDDGQRCMRCGVCHNVCGLMGREPGWIHRASAQAAGRRFPNPNDAKAQED